MTGDEATKIPHARTRSPMNPSQRRERGIKLLTEMLGPERAEQTFKLWRDSCPDLEEYIIEFVGGEIWSRPGLDRRTKSLVTVAVLAALNRPLALEINLRGAINNGATKQEVVETLLHIAPYAGFPATWEGLLLAQKVFAEGEKPH